jgi:hypothetical protein
LGISSSIRRTRPRLGAVFGPLTAAQDAEVRAILREIDDTLLALARHVGRERAGRGGAGLDLRLLESGHVSLGGFVEACDGGSRCVSFCAELRPAWCTGELSGEPAWEIETEVYADCGHAPNHRSMHPVHAAPATRATSPREATIALRAAVEELVRLARATPIDAWLRRAG